MSLNEEQIKPEEEILARVRSIDVRIQALEATRTEERLLALERHRQECNELHIKTSEHNKRRDDALNNLTSSNILLTEAVNTMTSTLTAVATEVRANAPLMIKLHEKDTTLRVGGTWINLFWKVLISIAAGIITLAGLYQLMLGGVIG